MMSTRPYHCPSNGCNDSENANAVQTGFTDYWMNTNVSGVRMTKIKALNTTLLAGDGNDGVDLTDARYSRNSLPQDWLHTADSPARRHLGSAFYLLADESLKSLKPNQVKSTHTRSKEYGFTVQ